MKKMKKGRLLCVALIAAALVVSCMTGIGSMTADAAYNGALASSNPDSILSKIPAYSYSGTFKKTYSMGASGWYYKKDATEHTEENIDPLLEGTPIDDALDGGEMMVYYDVDEAGYTSYRADLEALGYKLYDDNDLGGNLFATYVTGTEVVTLSYIPNSYSSNRLCILVEPMRDLPGLEDENVYENLNIPSSVTLVTCRFTEASNGQCFIYQLCDGSFILYDSGYGYGEDDEYPDHYQNQAKEIYATLMTLLPEGQEKPVIAGWFISHPHWDHMGGLITFADLYADKVTVEKFILNHPSQEVIQQLWPGNDLNIIYLRVMQNAIAKFDGAAMVEAHAGQTFYMRNAVIDVLCTWELQTGLGKKYIAVPDGNAASNVLSIELAGERMILFGDCQSTEVTLMEAMYEGDFLKADFVQPAHHGMNGMDTLYSSIDAEVAIWPSQVYRGFTEDGANAILMGLDNYKHGNGITYIPLPYSGDGTMEDWDGITPIHGTDKVLYWDPVNPLYGID